MKDVILLTKILFKGSANKNSDKKVSGKIILFALAYAYLAGIVGYISYEAIRSLIEINQPQIFLEMCFIGMLGLGLIQTIFSGLNILFFSKDIEYLLPLPIMPVKIVMAKFNCLIITQYIISSIIVLPILVVYGYLLKLGVTFYIIGFIVMLLFPVVPVIITATILTIIMKFTNIIRNKDVVQYLTVLLTLIIVFAIQIFSSQTSNQITNEELANSLVQTNGQMKVISDYFITLKSVDEALLNYNNIKGILNLGILLIETLFIYFLGTFISSKMYIKSVTKIVTSGIKKSKNINKDFKENKIYKSYVKKEFINLIRNPIFFMQCVLPSILFPFLFLAPIVISIKDTGAEEVMYEISQATKTPLILLASFGIVTFMYIFNFIALTSISRDRNNAVFMKYVPLSLEEQCLYKIIPGIILNLFPLIYFIILLKVVVPIVCVKVILYITIDLLLINICNNYIMIIVDLKNPKLEWITEYAVVKQNINMFFQMVIILSEVIIIAALCFNISSIDAVAVIVGAIYTIFIFLIQEYIKKNQKKLFNKIV